MSSTANRREKPKYQIVKPKILIFVWLVFSFASFSAPEVWSQNTILVPTGATWRYLDNGTDQGTAWREPAFNDAAWSAGPAELGYGDGDEATVISFGPDPANKYITTYFRRSFDVAEALIFSSLTLRVLRDDGAVVYLNGTEVFRTNMPAGTITSTTLASSAVGGADETTFQETSVDPGLLANGTNVLAVEIHQVNGTSSDISFNLEFIGHTRGPYLQMGTPTSMVVRWRTSVATDSRVRYGADPNSLPSVVDDAALTTEHVVTLTGLVSNTKYFYSIGTTTQILAGGDADHFFVTSPAIGTAKPTRVWVIGDSGTCGPPQSQCTSARAVRDAYLSFTGTRGTDVWLMLGDNAYFQGTDSQYQAAVFDTYPMLLRNTVLWPSPGNHDVGPNGVADSSTQTGPYYDNFTLPRSAEAGGLASGTEAYYSFDYGNIHFISLDSSDSDSDPVTGRLMPDGPMLTWLQDDLAATTQDWIIAYWHHAPYTKGSHDSDSVSDSGGRLVDMRELVLPILEARGVDLVLTGHSHSYERSFLINGFYATPTTITDGTIIDSGDGRLNVTGAYLKPTLGPAPNKGAVYAVVGSSGGQIGGGTLDHPLMFISYDSTGPSGVPGSMVLDVNGGQLDARFIDSNGNILDYFTIVKGTPRPACEIEMSQASYVNGDTVTATTLRIANPSTVPVSIEMKIWLGWPFGPPISVVNAGADGSVILPVGLDLNLGPVLLFPVTFGTPRGAYEFSCRMRDPVTGQFRAEDLNPFVIQ
jgi:hypothetical protein